MKEWSGEKKYNWARISLEDILSPYYTEKQFREIMAWCEDNCGKLGKQWKFSLENSKKYPGCSQDVFYFKKKEYVTLFQLRWQ